MKMTSEVTRKLDIRVNTLTKLFTLMYLYDKPMHGYEIMKKLNEALPYRVNPEQVYPFLHLLEERGLATISTVGEREKKVYSLTGKGKEVVEHLIERFGNLIEIVIKPQLNVCAHCGVKIMGEGYRLEVEGEELVFCCKHCAEHYVQTKIKVKRETHSH